MSTLVEPQVREVAPAVVSERDCPYPGLRPFRESEAKFFCGRSQHRIELLTKLEESRFVAVVGASGSGKSSLVMAGLLCDIADGMLIKVPAGKSRVVYFKPGLNPFAALASSLSARICGDVREVERVLRRSAFGFGNVLDLFDRQEDALIVIADQFEELFRFARLTKKETEAPDFQKDRRETPLLDGVHNEAQAFVDLLLEASKIERRQVFVVLTMRSDFLHRCEAFDRLPGMISTHQYLTPRLQRDQQADAIAVPLKHFGATIKPALVNLILNDLSPEQDQLPILQHALARIWLAAQHRKSNELTITDYEKVGGIADALNEHGDEILREVFKASGRRLGEEEVGRFFRCLAEFDPMGALVRRPRTVAQVAAESGLPVDDVRLIAECFRANFTHWLMPMVDPKKPRLDDNEVLDLTHESLLRKWDRLSAKPSKETVRAWKDNEKHRSRLSKMVGWMWVEQQRRDSLLKLKERMVDAGWQADGTPPASRSLLWRVIGLSNAIPLTWFQFSRFAKALRRPSPPPEWGERYGWSVNSTRLFLRLVLFRLIGFWTLILIVVGTALFLNAKKGVQLAIAQQVREIQSLLHATEIERAEQQSEKLVGELKEAKQTIEQLQDRLAQQQRILDTANALDSGAPNVLFTQLRDLLDGQGYRTEVATTTPVETGTALSRAVVIPAHDKPVHAVAFLEIDGVPHIASGAQDHKTNLWKLDGSLASVISRHDATSLTTANGSQLVMASADAYCRIFIPPNSLAEMKLPNPAPGEGVVSGQTISDGRVLFGTTAGRIGLWNPDGGEISLFPTQDSMAVNSLSYSAARQMVVSSHDGGDKGMTQLWTIKGPSATLLLSTKYAWPVRGASFDPTGNWVLVPTATRELRLVQIEGWDGTALPVVPKSHRLPHQAPVVMGRFSPTGDLLATADNRGRIYLWSLAAIPRAGGEKISQAQPLILSGHSKRVTALEWDPTGRCLASGDESGTILIWQEPGKRVSTGNAKLPFVLPGHEAVVMDLTISQKGRFIATAGADKTVRVAPFYPTFSGKCLLNFGGLDDQGVSEGEGLALFDQNQMAIRRDLFLSDKELADKGLGETEIAKLGAARRLKADRFYVAARWDYSLTSRSFLRGTKVKVRNPRNGKEVLAQPVDWGPNPSSGAVADLSPGLGNALEVTTDDTVEIVVDLLALPDPNSLPSAE